MWGLHDKVPEHLLADWDIQNDEFEKGLPERGRESSCSSQRQSQTAKFSEIEIMANKQNAM